MKPVSICFGAATLKRIADARWSPYIDTTLIDWASAAVASPDACAGSRPMDCAACATLHEIIDFPWSVARALHIQELARTSLGLPSARASLGLVEGRRRA
jgi:hypothetical protein